MSYSQLLENEVKQEHMLCILKPRRKVSSFTLFSGSVYEADLDYTEWVSKVEIDGLSATLGTSSSLSAGQYYWDSTNRKLYLRTSDSTDPSTKFCVVTFELYFSTLDASWHRDPLDDTTLEVYYEPFIIQAPQLKATISDLLQGYLPVQSSSITLSNAEHTFEQYLYDTSFNKCEISVYHWLSKETALNLEVSNIKLILRGICSNVTYNQSTVSINILDRVDLFDTEWRNELESFYTLDTFPNLDPDYIGKPIRYVYGRVEGFKPVNVSKVQYEPTTSDNREWCLLGENTGLGEISRTVLASPSSTTTRTYLNSVVGLQVGDSIFMDGATDYYNEITAVGANYIEHSANAAPMSSGEFVKRGFVSSITIMQNGLPFKALYQRDYTCSDNLLSSGLSGIVFSTSLESNLSMPNTLQPSDQIFCTVYGPTNSVTLGGNPFGSNDSVLGNLADPAVILWNVLKTKTEMSESDLDSDSFEDFQTLVGAKSIGFAIPKNASENFPKIKDIVIDIMQSTLGKIFLNDDLEWSVSRIAPLTTEDWSTTDDEILSNRFNATFEYNDLQSDINIEYGYREVTNSGSNSSSTTSSNSQIAELLHKQKSQKTYQCLLVFETDAKDLADNICSIYGDRQATYSIDINSRFFPIVMSDILKISREKLPGFSYVAETLRDRKFSILEIQKGLRRVSLKLTDQKGIEESTWQE